MKGLRKNLDKNLNIKSSVPTNREQDKVVYGYKKGDWILSPLVLFDSFNDKNENKKNNTFQIQTLIGNFISDKSAITGGIVYQNDIFSSNSVNTKNSLLRGVLGFQYYFMNIKNRIKLSYSFIIGYGNDDIQGIDLYSDILLDYFITKNIIISYTIINNIIYNSTNEFSLTNISLNGQINNIFAEPVINLVFKL